MKPLTVQQAYNLLSIPKNLQEHHLRVAGLLQILCDNWTGDEINSHDIVLAGLFHDAANILKFNFNNPDMMGDEANRVDYWRQVQQEVITKYGNNIHQATLKMCQEANLSKPVLRIVDGLEWDRIKTVITKHNWPVALAIYADMRIGPFGLLSITERINNLHQRRPLINYNQVIQSAIALEKLLQESISIPLNSIQNQDLDMLFPELIQRKL